jgi:phosphate transport system substrate-binding protein
MQVQMPGQMKNFIAKVAVLALSVGAACAAGSSTSQAETVTINGAGATFPYPLYSKWMDEYKKKNGVEINYASIGSGAGISKFLDKTVDFGASDAPMSDEQLTQAKVAVVHIPTAMGAVVITYNVPGVTSSLQMTGDVIADIYLGKIKTWDDAKIVALNKGVKLPAGLPIVPCYRSDGSGTTFVFTDYLSKTGSDWKDKVGKANAIKWPAGIGAKGNEGVTGLVKQTKGSVGYVELVYALSNKMPVANVRNKDGKFITPSVSSVTAAAAALKSMPEDFRVSITDASGKESYPISSFTYVLIYQNMDTPKGKPIVDFLKWAVTEGQKFSPGLNYSPLPGSLVKKIQDKLNSISVASAGK